MSFGTRVTFIAALVRTSLAVMLRDLSEGAGSITKDRPTDIDNASQAFYSYIIVICASLALLVMIWRIILGAVMFWRTLACLNNPTQRYFLLPSETFASFKRYF